MGRRSRAGLPDVQIAECAARSHSGGGGRAEFEAVILLLTPRGGGGDPSVLDANYPPPINCWPEAPWGVQGGANGGGGSRRGLGGGGVGFGCGFGEYPARGSVAPPEARPKAWGTKHSAASTPDLCTPGTHTVSPGCRRAQTLSIALHERPHYAGPLPELYPCTAGGTNTWS